MQTAGVALTERGRVLVSSARAPRFSISQISTFAASFDDDLDAYAAAGLDGIGIWELKLPQDGDDGAALEAFERSGLESASAVPLIPSILPLPRLGGPTDPAARIDALCASIHRLARFPPSGIVCLSGSGAGLDPDAARTVVVDGLRTLAREAELAGVAIAFEPYQRDGGEDWSIATSIPEAVELIEEAGDHPSLGLQFDVWHLWNTPTLFDDIRREVRRFAGVHVSDVRSPTRSWADRVLPGDGVADVPAVLAALDEAGWNGLYDLEVFSDNGTFGSAHEGSLWDVPAGELARRGRAAMAAAWESRPRLAASTPTQRQEEG
jgi:sugar phosphate isomerase/epimerase